MGLRLLVFGCCGVVSLVNSGFMVSLITGFILAGTSSAVVLPLVGSLKMDAKPGTILILLVYLLG